MTVLREAEVIVCVKYIDEMNWVKKPPVSSQLESTTGYLSSSQLVHCSTVLQQMATFHAVSLFISRISQQSLSELFPFAVEAETFRQEFHHKIIPVKEELLGYLRWCFLYDESVRNSLDLKIHKLFWKLVEMKAKPSNSSHEVLIHGNINYSNVMFRYKSGKPIDCKFVSLANVSVSCSIIDIIIYIYSVFPNDIVEQSYLSFLLTYHSHLSQLCQQLNITDHISLADLVNQFEQKKFWKNSKLQSADGRVSSEPG